MTLPLHPPDIGPDAYLRDAVAGPIRHAGDVSQLLQGGVQRWTDALLSEVRAHLSGCLNAVEAGIGILLGDSWLARPVEALGPGYCRLAIERHPAVLSPVLLDHLRLRAAAAMALRMSLAWPVMPEDGETAPEPVLPDGPLADALATLRLSVDPWFSPHPLDRLMRADLTAEAYCELVWTVAALLAEGLTARMGVDHGAAMPILARAAETLIARHDEQTGPFARASYAATWAQDGETGMLTEQAALRHDLLLFAALGEARTGIPIEQAMGLLVDGEPEERAALARLLGLSDVAYVALLDALAPIQDAPDDSLLPDIASRYRLLTDEEAVHYLSRWRGPAPLVAKLARMGWTRP
jgi:hypothetical protein